MSDRSSLRIMLAACEADRIQAGADRDGTGTARINVVLNMLDALARTCRDLSSDRFLSISAERDKARTTKRLCVIHDRAARGELTGDDYDKALAPFRAQLRGEG
jgi:hypothetical protein